VCVLTAVRIEVLGTIQTEASLKSFEDNLCQRNGLTNPIPETGQPYPRGAIPTFSTDGFLEISAEIVLRSSVAS
jgi:hypothetical protein